MHLFKYNAETWARLDYQIIQYGNFKREYTDIQTLQQDMDWLAAEGYEIKAFDCTDWNDKEILHNHLHDKFDFPAYYGRNFDAMQESLNEEKINGSGLVVVFKNFDSITPKIATTLLDVFTCSARFHLSFGERMIILIEK